MKKEKYIPRTCKDCGVPNDVEQVILKDSVWAWTPKIILCFFCIEKRLGRKLQFDDLSPDAALNLQWIARIWLRELKGAPDISIPVLNGFFLLDVFSLYSPAVLRRHPQSIQKSIPADIPADCC